MDQKLFRLSLAMGWKRIIRRFANPPQYVDYLRSVGYRIGDHTSIPAGTGLPMPELIRIGSNVRFSSNVNLIPYEGSVAMLNRAYGERLDRVGPIVIRDNVFVGMGSIIRYGVTLGPNVVVGCNSTVVGDWRDAVVAGGPARYLCSCDDLVDRIKRGMQSYPWKDTIRDRQGAFDPAVEPALARMREAHFLPAA